MSDILSYASDKGVLFMLPLSITNMIQSQWFYMAMAYLVGSLSFALIVSHVTGNADPRSYGSGNPGATNMLRGGYKVAALLTLLGDSSKGWLVVAMASFYGLPLVTIAACAVAALLGHMYPIFFGFKGGKGVATALGILLGLSLKLAFFVLVIWLIVMALFRISSLASISASVSAPPLAYFLWDKTHPFGFSCVVMACLILYRHIPNIRNLLTQKETPIGKDSVHKKR